ncbi:peptidyl-prolyl cis-trans isomerase [Bacteroides sp. 224]|uniref:peptidyl-prolyl cis-trans isomerase n=1 Tax=Bacteroides sp. 224 TaxID=2302936 RepID=UPI0013CF9216|nr:peptidyl-prolyl cis-trans isomerase [Bacteroides sp. 224]NDV64566.1 peptidyl-prolyl cis-trans isomerase [Bacteroides sp. 224]
MRLTGLLLFFFLLCVSCNGNRNSMEENLLVEVNGEFLYKDDLQKVLPVGLSKDDSLLFAENYIRNWVEDILLYNVAKTNIPNSEEVDKLVESYRKTLIIHTYQQELISQRLSSEIPERELTEFYENNKRLFILERPLVKGLFIRVPLAAPNMNDVRKWYKTETQEAIEYLEKYSLQHALSYDYFYDKWITLSEVLGKMPLKEVNQEDYVAKHRHIELQDTVSYYFLNVTDYLGVGDEKPYDFARPSVIEIITNMKRVNFIKDMKSDLYKEALKGNKIKYNY